MLEAKKRRAISFSFPPLGGSDSLCLRAASPTFDDQATPPKKSKNLANISPPKKRKKNLIFQHNSFFLDPYAAKLRRVFMGPNWATNMRQ